MANKYRSVLASGGGVQPTGNAQPADVLSGKTFSNADGIDKTGTMPNNGAVSQTLNGGQSYTIPAGFHNGSGTVTAAKGTIIGSFTIAQGGSHIFTELNVGDLLFGSGTPFYPTSSNPDTLVDITIKESTAVYGSAAIPYMEITGSNPSITITNAGGHSMSAIAVRL